MVIIFIQIIFVRIIILAQKQNEKKALIPRYGKNGRHYTSYSCPFSVSWHWVCGCIGNVYSVYS